jgi:hypothetical protein
LSSCILGQICSGRSEEKATIVVSDLVFQMSYAKCYDRFYL